MPEYDTTKRNYEAAHEWHAEKSMAYNWTPHIDSFLQLVPANTKILDAGCGDGRDVRTFKSRNVDVEGLDYSHPAIESLKQQFPDGKFYEADMRNTGLPDNSYGGVWACASILNISKADAPTALREFRRVLVPSGILFLSVKEGEGERMVPDKAGERFFNFFSQEELTSLVQVAGFTIDHTEVMEDTFGKAPEGQKLPRWICVYAKKI